MSALMQILAACHRKFEKTSFVTTCAQAMNRSSEIFWFVLSLGLFLLMGPFSIIAVVAGLYQLSRHIKNEKAPESVGW